MSYLAGKAGRSRSGRGMSSSARGRTRPPVVFACPRWMRRGSSGTRRRHLQEGKNIKNKNKNKKKNIYFSFINVQP